MLIAVCQLNPTIGDLEGNTRAIIKCLEESKAKLIDMVVFPELAICGYAPEDLLLHQAFIEKMELCLKQIIEASKGIAVCVGLARRNLFQGEKDLFNSAAIIQDGKLLGYHDKWLLPTYDVFDERRYFEAGKDVKAWTIKGVKVAITICEDIWKHAGYVDLTAYEHDPIKAVKDIAPDVLINIAASPYQDQKMDMRLNVCAKAAKTLNCPVIMCCQVGANDQIIFDGYSIHVNKEGKLSQIAKGFKEDLMLIDLKELSPSIKLPLDSLHDLHEALALGIHDYMHKNQFHTVCLGLSGGIDSALVAELAVKALGHDKVIGVLMPSKYTSDASTEDALKLAKNLKIKTMIVPIDKAVNCYHETLHEAFLGKPEDVTEENLQARIRGVILMALSNKHGYIVLSTGNKSELSMGYCTLYGDMCGALCVIGDVAKTKVYELCRYINAKAGFDKIPEAILNKAPSAELKFNQTDQDSLPEYEIIDQVIKGYIEDYLKAEQIADKYQLPLDLVQMLIKKIHLAEYKRRQAPPILRISKKSFGIGRHYPIVQGWRT